MRKVGTSSLILVALLMLSGCIRDYNIVGADGAKTGTLTIADWPIDRDTVTIKRAGVADLVYVCDWNWSVCKANPSRGE